MALSWPLVTTYAMRGKVKENTFFLLLADHFVPLRHNCKSAKMLYRVVVTGHKGERFDIDLCDTKEQFKSLTVLDLKRKILQKLPWYREIDRVFLIFADERLDEDDKLLTDYGIQHMSGIQVVLKVDGGGPGPVEGHMGETVYGGGLPGPEGHMGDRDHKNLSMEHLADFDTPQEEDKGSRVLQ